MKKSKSKKKIAIRITIIIVAVIFIIFLHIIIWVIYNSVFGKRMETRAWTKQYPSDYIGLNMEEVSFLSNKNQKLQGYKFSKENQDVNGVLILSHGLGSGF